MLVLSLALLASRGTLAITRDMISANKVETLSIGLENLLAISRIGHRCAACRWMALLAVATLLINPWVSGTRQQSR